MFAHRFELDGETIHNQWTYEGWRAAGAWFFGSGTAPGAVKLGILTTTTPSPLQFTDTLASHPGWTDQNAHFGRSSISLPDPFRGYPFFDFQSSTVVMTNGDATAKTVNGFYITDDSTLFATGAGSGKTVQPGASINVQVIIQPRYQDPFVQSRFEFASRSYNVCGSGNVNRDDEVTQIGLVDPRNIAVLQGADLLTDIDGNGGSLNVASVCPTPISPSACYENIGPVNWPTTGAILIQNRTDQRTSVDLVYASAPDSNLWPLGGRVGWDT